MKRISQILMHTLFYTLLFGQTAAAQYPVQAAAIIKRIKEGNEPTRSIALAITAKKDHYSLREFDGYRICDNKVYTIDTLDALLNDAQTDSLFNEDDATLKLVGFILYARKHNNKKLLTAKLNDMLTYKYHQMLSDGECNHSIRVSDLTNFAYEVLTIENQLFKPAFTFTKKDKQYWKNRLEQYRLLAN